MDRRVCFHHRPLPQYDSLNTIASIILRQPAVYRVIMCIDGWPLLPTADECHAVHNGFRAPFTALRLFGLALGFVRQPFVHG